MNVISYITDWQKNLKFVLHALYVRNMINIMKKTKTKECMFVNVVEYMENCIVT